MLSTSLTERIRHRRGDDADFDLPCGSGSAHKDRLSAVLIMGVVQGGDVFHELTPFWSGVASGGGSEGMNNVADEAKMRQRGDKLLRWPSGHQAQACCEKGFEDRDGIDLFHPENRVFWIVW